MPIIQLQPHSIARLPQHPDLEARGPGQSLQDHIRATLEEAHEILDSLPTELKAEPRLRKSPPADAKVKLSQGWRTPLHSEPNSEKEYWVSRESEHEDSNRGDGSASWREFQTGLHHDHASHEMEYTPSVTRVVTLLNWTDGDDHTDQDIDIKHIRYSCFEVQLLLIIHTFKPGRLIMPRAFLSFTVSAVTRNLLSSTRNTSKARQTTEGFITIQVPYFMEMPQQSPEFLDHQYNGLFTKIITHVPRGTIFAHYASIERVELLVLPIDRSSSVATSCEGNTEANAPSTWESSATSTGRRIKWTMATTSDAGGKIPSCVQRSWLLGGIPKAVVADVGLFIGWIVKKRRPSSARQEGEPEQEQDI